MKKMNKKGFTIVELVIVIAVIAILAAVMIPTFGGIIKKANESSALQTVTAAYKNALVEVMADGSISDTEAAGFEYEGYVFTFANGKLSGVTEKASPAEYTYTVDAASGTITAATKN